LAAFSIDRTKGTDPELPPRSRRAWAIGDELIKEWIVGRWKRIGVGGNYEGWSKSANPKPESNSVQNQTVLEAKARSPR
jgi:hypothetical protein